MEDGITSAFDLFLFVLSIFSIASPNFIIASNVQTATRTHLSPIEYDDTYSALFVLQTGTNNDAQTKLTDR